MTKRKLAGRPATRQSLHTLAGPGEDVAVDQLIDMGSRQTGIAAGLFEELTIADLRHLGVSIVPAPPPRRKHRRVNP